MTPHMRCMPEDAPRKVDADCNRLCGIFFTRLYEINMGACNLLISSQGGLVGCQHRCI